MWRRNENGGLVWWLLAKQMATRLEENINEIAEEDSGEK